MTTFNVLKQDQIISRLVVEGNQVTGDLPSFLQQSIDNILHKNDPDRTIEDYLTNYCDGTANLLSLERTGSGLQQV